MDKGMLENIRDIISLYLFNVERYMERYNASFKEAVFYVGMKLYIEIMGYIWYDLAPKMLVNPSTRLVKRYMEIIYTLYSLPKLIIRAILYGKDVDKATRYISEMELEFDEEAVNIIYSLLRSIKI